MKSVKGFTLVELVVTVAVLAIVLAIAAPAMTSWIAESQARSQVNLYRDMFTFARAEAISRGQPVRVKALNDNSWVVGTGNPASCASATALRCFPAATDATVTSSIAAGGLVFTPQGQVSGQAAGTEVTVTLAFSEYCNANRVISINGIGRVRSVQGSCS